uniref:protein-tyrosine-phosphatase n=1 Tax=Chelonoidis abingdonii TaxID=106734 RepID=A0A8C0HCL4_CHEAB
PADKPPPPGFLPFASSRLDTGEETTQKIVVVIKSPSAREFGKNIKKNRYKDILPYDQTRVVLNLCTDEGQTDYINASFIQVTSSLCSMGRSPLAPALAPQPSAALGGAVLQGVRGRFSRGRWAAGGG